MEEHVLLQAVKNTSQSIELLREAVSNSVDAECKNIDIKMTNVGGDLWDIVIQDDGNGMTDAHMQAFFNTGASVKDAGQPSIGEKGLGSKTTFVAKEILVESRRIGSETDLLVGRMVDPLAQMEKTGSMPVFDIDLNPAAHSAGLSARGTRITLSKVHLTTFNGMRTQDPRKIADRTLHYLRSMCATGTVKNRHAVKSHIVANVTNVGVLPLLTLEVTGAGEPPVTLGPVVGAYEVPAQVPSPTGGATVEGIPRNSSKFCDTLDFTRSKTFTVGNVQETVHYDGTAIVAGEAVRGEMLEHELKQGWTHKTRMGVHLCKDFIPLRADGDLSRSLLDPEYYYEYKVFINSQSFELNADRNVVTNIDSDAVAWILEDFHGHVWPDIQKIAQPYRDMKGAEDAAIEAAIKTKQANHLKTTYPSEPDVAVTKKGASLAYVKSPKNEAAVSHILAMVVQSGHWAAELAPIAKFGQYIDASTDVLVEKSDGTVMLVEIELELPNLFRHQHPMTSYDAVVVWTRGNMKTGDHKSAPWGDNGSDVSVTLKKAAKGWELKWGTHSKPLIVLEEIL